MVDGFVRTLATVAKYNVAGSWGGVDLRDFPLNVPFSLCGMATVSVYYYHVHIVCLLYNCSLVEFVVLWMYLPHTDVFCLYTSRHGIG